MAQHPNIQIWPGSGSFCPGQSTPFGYFDSDPHFIIDADRLAVWVARRLGYPITDVELTEDNFYAAFEEAALEYSSMVNSYNARDNMLSLSGTPTGSLELSNQYIQPTLKGIFQIAKQYGVETGAGGTQTWFSGSVDLKMGVQVYQLNSSTTSLESGDPENDIFTVRRIFYENTSPLNGSVNSVDNLGTPNFELLNQFGWGNMGAQYVLMPLHYDLLRSQALEMHSQIRRSGYSFQLTGNRLRIFPIPQVDSKLYFLYTIDSDAISGTGNTPGSGIISDYSNIPYGIKKYRYINEIGKSWIRRYALALCKEMLGWIRSKYSDIPLTGDNTITLNGSDLISSAETEKQNLIDELREILDSMSRQSQLERKVQEADSLMQQLTKIPLKIYVK
jgi:hypothetical protein